MSTLLISDLHLEDARPDITRAFFSLLEQFENNVGRLFILGDFFEIWLGDDALTEIAQQVAVRLRQFSEAGSDVYIMHGNRDFLLGQDYAQRCGASLISDPFETVIAGQRCLLMHGDTLCTDDKLYMDFRKMVRNPDWQKSFLKKTIEERIAFGRQARNQSQEDAKDKTYEILDVNQEAVMDTFQKHEVPLLIHGHTHRPDRHLIKIEDQNVERIVLGDWNNTGWYLIADESDLALKSFDFPQQSS